MFVSGPATCSGGYEQRAAKSQALNMVIDLRQTRRLMLEQQTNSLQAVPYRYRFLDHDYFH
jgi:hypothetical protein